MERVYKQTKEHRFKIALSHIGLKPTERTRRKMGIKKRNSKHPMWKGDNATYTAKHRWVARHYGKPDTCEKCLLNGLSGRMIHWASKSGKHKRLKSDWIRLCIKCHGEYDKKHGLRKRKTLSITSKAK